jgi:hypothetical protein
MFGNWVKFGWDWTMLVLECQQVIALRMAKISLGGMAASREASRAVSEKVTALVQLGASGGSPHSAVKKYRKKVRSNRRRLTRRG